MPGLSSRNDRRRSAAWWLPGLLLVIAVLACRPGGVGRGTANAVAVASRADTVGAEAASTAAADMLAVECYLSFRGWRGEDPVLREETLFQDGALRVDYLVVQDGGACLQIATPPVPGGDRASLPVDPEGLQPGRVLVEDGEVRDEGSQLTLAEHPDAGAPDRLVIELQLAADADALPARRWELACALSPTLGESGPEYEPVSVQSASVSPGGGRLLVGLRGGGLPRFLLLDLREEGRGAFVAR